MTFLASTNATNGPARAFDAAKSMPPADLENSRARRVFPGRRNRKVAFFANMMHGGSVPAAQKPA